MGTYTTPPAQAVANNSLTGWGTGDLRGPIRAPLGSYRSQLDVNAGTPTHCALSGATSRIPRGLGYAMWPARSASKPQQLRFLPLAPLIRSPTGILHVPLYPKRATDATTLAACMPAIGPYSLSLSTGRLVVCRAISATRRNQELYRTTLPGWEYRTSVAGSSWKKSR